MIFVRLPADRWDCWLAEPLQWRWNHVPMWTEAGTINRYTVAAAGFRADPVSTTVVSQSPEWIPIRSFLSPDDASQMILDMQSGRCRPEQAQDWSPGRGGGTVVGERVETVADLHVSRVVRGAARMRRQARR